MGISTKPLGAAGRYRVFEGRLFSWKQDFSASCGNMLLRQDFPFNETSQLAWFGR
jgi:hypothetical protein